MTKTRPQLMAYLEGEIEQELPFPPQDFSLKEYNRFGNTALFYVEDGEWLRIPISAYASSLRAQEWNPKATTKNHIRIHDESAIEYTRHSLGSDYMKKLKDVKSMDIAINCFGGLQHCMNDIIQWMSALKAQRKAVRTWAFGHVQSAASWIWFAGDRKYWEGADFLFHTSDSHSDTQQSLDRKQLAHLFRGANEAHRSFLLKYIETGEYDLNGQVAIDPRRTIQSDGKWLWDIGLTRAPYTLGGLLDSYRYITGIPQIQATSSIRPKIDFDSSSHPFFPELFWGRLSRFLSERGIQQDLSQLFEE